MDWRAFLISFGLIFLAEFGDKTQLEVIGLVAKSNSPWAVFLGAIAALVIATLLAVLFGELLLKVLPVKYIRIFAGTLFIILGILIILGQKG